MREMGINGPGLAGYRGLNIRTVRERFFGLL
jgi:hypothetical protein